MKRSSSGAHNITRWKLNEQESEYMMTPEKRGLVMKKFIDAVIRTAHLHTGMVV